MAARPMVTVIMPIRNEEAYIAHSLGAVLAQDYPRDRLEVLVADGMSTDGTRSAIEKVLANVSPRPAVKLLDNRGGIVSKGFNLALEQSRGDVIVRVDGHTVIMPDYVQQCVNALESTGAANVGGRMDAVGQGLIGDVVALATSSPFGIGWSRFHFSQREEWVDTVYLGAWPRQVFTDFGKLDEHLVRNEDDEFNHRIRKLGTPVGVFDEELLRNQDDEFNYRIRKHGGRILLSPAIRSLYFNRARFGDLWRQYFQYGFWKVRVLQKHPLQMRPRQFVPVVFVAILIVSGVASIFTVAGRWVFAGVVLSYLVAVVLASLWSARRATVRHVLGLLVTFPILHVSYGVGFLIGLFRFMGRWGKAGAS